MKSKYKIENTGKSTKFNLKFPKQKMTIKEFKNLPKQPYRVIKSNKYGAVKKEYKGGLYHSTKEAIHAQELDLLLKTKKIKSWRRQVKIDLQSNGYHIANYYVDFEVTHNDGLIEFQEVKGYETDVFKMKWRLFESMYGRNPNYRLTIIK